MDTYSHTKAYKAIDHALHNEEACHYLFDEHFNDWVITTAFYAAMHYMRHKLFPMEIVVNGQRKVVHSFDEYCIEKNIYSQKHKEMRLLTEEKCASAMAAMYNQMMDISFTARYNNYQFPKSLAELTKSRLASIKTDCLPPR